MKYAIAILALFASSAMATVPESAPPFKDVTESPDLAYKWGCMGGYKWRCLPPVTEPETVAGFGWDCCTKRPYEEEVAFFWGRRGNLP